MRLPGLLAAAAIATVACTRTPRSSPLREAAIQAPAPPIPPLAPVVEAPSPPPPAPPPPPPFPEARQTLVAEGGHVVEVYPPLDTPAAAAPLVVFLHATCMEPADVCDFWSRAGREGSWLVCPAGPSTCYGAPDWAGTPKVRADALGAALAVVDGTYGSWVDRERGDVLIGYSRGAYAARDILYQKAGRFHGLILLSAYVSPEPALLKAAGIRRAVMATGDLDGSRPTMLRAVKTLENAGIPTRFVSLGRIGHWLPENLADILRDALVWVELPVS